MGSCRMKFLRYVLYFLLGLVALFVLVGLFAKKNYHIERSIDIRAPRAVVHEQVRYFKNFQEWSPWSSYDPDMTVTISGTDGQPGAVYEWAGNDDVGSGKQTIKAVTPTRVDIDVTFTEPWESTSPSFFLLEPRDSVVHVSWGFDMHIAFPWNAIAMLTDVAAYVGEDYDRGLAALKERCETLANKTYRGYKIDIVDDLPLRNYLGVRQMLSFSEIPKFYGTTLSKIMETIQKDSLQMTGAPAGLFWSYDETTGKSDMAAGIPVAGEQAPGGYAFFPVGGKQTLIIHYYGPYDKTGEAHFALDDYMKEKGLQNVPPVLEEYVTDPKSEPDTAKWLTRIIYMVEEKK